MRRKGSRYENTQAFGEDKAFSGYRERKLDLPAGIVEHTILFTDRLDHLADAYYKTDRRWWRLLDANAEFMYGFEMLDEEFFGDVISIPAARGNSQ